MIHSIYLMHSSGICLSSRSYSDAIIDEDLFSGFLAAISNFIQEIARDKLIEIKMEQNHIFYDSKEAVLMTIIASSDIDRVKLDTVFQEILDAFFHSFKNHLNHNILHKNQFGEFEKTIDEILFNNGFLKKPPVVSKSKKQKRKRKR